MMYNFIRAVCIIGVLFHSIIVIGNLLTGDHDTANAAMLIALMALFNSINNEEDITKIKERHGN